MNRFFLLILIWSFCNSAKSQTKAVTENGREVILFENGTWKYSNDSVSTNILDSLVLNPHKFFKANETTFLVKSNTLNIGVYINPVKWAFSPHRDNEKNPEYRFNLKSGEGYALLVTEKTPIDLETMRQIALLNAQKASFDATETHAEYRIVNDKKVLCLIIKGTIKGIKFTYLGYYYSNSNGTVQFLSYTTQAQFEELQKELEGLLNGLIEIDK